MQPSGAAVSQVREQSPVPVESADRGWWPARLAAPGRGLLLVGLAVAETAMAIVVLTAVSLIPLGIGVFLLPHTAAGLRGLANRSRAWAADWSKVPIAAPYPPMAGPEHTGLVGRVRRCREILTDRTFWRDLVWAMVDPISGALLAGVPFSLIVYGLFGAAVQPFIWKIIDDAGGSNWYTAIHVNSTGRALIAVPIGVGILVAGLLLGPTLLRQHARLTRALLGPTRNTALAQRVERLTTSRAEAIDIQAAELRRIERDLHDGAQARLVAMGMSLADAERILEDDPAAARALLLEARATSSRALEELRDLVRGIHPPVLADRGLGDAVLSLALDSVVDVDVEVDLPARLAAPVESAAYFAINEVLTNAAKHSGARRIQVAIGYHQDVLRVTVTDDGRGGADPSRGTGLRGIERRLAAFDGTLALHSPLGGPTTVRMEIPCALSSPKTSSY